MSNILDVGQYVTELIPGVDKMKLYKIASFPRAGTLPGPECHYLKKSCKLGQKDLSPMTSAAVQKTLRVAGPFQMFLEEILQHFRHLPEQRLKAL